MRDGAATQVELEARWVMERYMREAWATSTRHTSCPQGPTRAENAGELFYVERGRIRRLSHPLLAALFNGAPLDIDPAELAKMPAGVPVVAIHDGGHPAYVIVDGQKVQLQLGMRLTRVEDRLLADIPEAETPLRWIPLPSAVRN